MKNRAWHNPRRAVLAALMFVPLVALAAGNGAVGGDSPGGDLSAAAARGQKIVADRSLGNCLACHTMKGSDVPSNVGPELTGMKARFPDPKQLYAIIFDEETRNPQTVMPPFGKNLILNSQQINDVIAFLYSQ